MFRARVRFIVVSVFAVVLLAGCVNTLPPLDIKRVSPPVLPAAASADLFDANRKPFRFEKIVIGLRRGEIYAHFPSAFGSPTSGFLCNWENRNANIQEWDGGSKYFGGWRDELGEVFFDTMRNAGYEVVGDPKRLFNANRETQSAEYRVGAVITDIKGNICQVADIWDGMALDKYSAEFYVKVSWQVYSVFSRTVVKTFETEGYGITNAPQQQGTMMAFNRAFVTATEYLAAEPDFKGLMNGAEDEADKGPRPGSYKAMTLTGAWPSKKAMKSWHHKASDSVVRVRGGSGHGSGFIVSDDGYVLTNYHVVGEAKRVAVIFENNLEVVGEVERRNKSRDVALVKVPLGSLMPLPIGSASELQETDTVYAIGAPLREDLQSTVSQGIVSAFRIFPGENQPLIQSDVDIHGGNSGGPLLDPKGNVVGISVSGIGPPGQFSAGLNFFIPIDDALKKLKVTMRPTKHLKRPVM